MAKPRTVFACKECGHISARWLGRCPSCNSWDSFSEELEQSTGRHEERRWAGVSADTPKPLPDIHATDTARVATGIGEFDRILGGGIVPGSAVLIGGDPGIGKSTLLLQAADKLALAGHTVLYVTGEESGYQVKLRANRLGCDAAKVLVVSETNLDAIRGHLSTLKPALTIIDSIQTAYDPDITSAPGSVPQVRECAAALVHQAKAAGTPIMLIGHVTKEGNIAGPRTLEHMVDTVLYFEGDKYHNFRVLRAVKNRFGATSEIGIFEMGVNGLQEVLNPSKLFLDEYDHERPGAAIFPALEGTRVLLVELQALAAPSQMSSPPRRVTGLDYARAAMLLAVLDRRAGLSLARSEVYFNVVGGVTIEEPAADLAACFAVASSLTDRKLPPATVIIGEIGLGGEVRAVNNLNARLEEAAKLGFTQAIVPKSRGETGFAPPEGMKLWRVTDLREALAKFYLLP